MLVLTRKKSEEIRIGNDIVIKVIQTGKGTIKLGIEAPRDIRVLRGELEAFAEGATSSKAVEVDEVCEEAAEMEEADGIPLVAPLHREMLRFRMSRAMCEMA